MTDSNSFLPNPGYGGGSFRRRIRLTATEGGVHTALEDDFHAFRLSLQHDGERITAVDGQSLRAPSYSCREAPARLQRFIGCTLSTERAKFRSFEDASQHCTHLYDLLSLASAQALRPHGIRQYDVTVADAQSGASQAQITLDDVGVHCWSIDVSAILEPQHLNGLTLKKGFAHWASDLFAGDVLEAAFVLQMGIFVANGRRFDVEKWRRDFQKPEASRGPVCYAFQPEVRVRYRPMLGSTRDFSDSPDHLLQFK